MSHSIKKLVNTISIFAIFIGLFLIFVAGDVQSSNNSLRGIYPERIKDGQEGLIPPHESLNTDYTKLITTYGVHDPPYITAISDGSSSGTTPTNVDTNVTFIATSTDPDSDDWKLLVCSTSSAPTASTSTPTCAGSEDWCVSSSWASSTISNTCTHTATSTDAESNAWWAWTCDYNVYDPKCSTSSSQGTGDTGSPFMVNHWPTFTSVDDDGPIDSGDTLTFTSVASDSDIDTATDTVSLLICKTAGLTGTACDGGASDTWATSTLTTSNPSATTTAIGVSSNDYYSYIFDNHNLGASNNGTSSSFTINNATPTVSSVIVNSGSNITLIEGGTTTVSVTATVSDTNGCGDIATTTLKFYRSGVTDSCSADDNNCYDSITCTQDGGTCLGGDDTSATYICNADIWYYADGTDSGTYEAEDWVGLVTAQDTNALSHSASSTVDMYSLSAFSITDAIAYGTMPPGDTSSQASTTITNTGNTRIDMSITGSSMSCEIGSMPATSQHYSFASGFSWADGKTLSTTEPGICSYFVPELRGAGSALKDSDEAYILGGYDKTNSVFNTNIYSFDPSDTSKLARDTGHDIPQGLEFAPAVAYSAKIYLFGGYWLDASSTAHYSDQIVQYDPATGIATSTGIGDLPVQLSGASAGLNTSDNKIYIFGGWNNTGEIYNTNIYSFDPTSPSSTAVDTGHDLPQGLKDAALSYDSTSGNFYIFGGYYDSGGEVYYVNNIARYTGSANATNVATLPFQLRGATANAKDSDEIYVLGGYDNTNSIHNSTILSYNPSSDTTNAATTTNSFSSGFKDAPSIYDPTSGGHFVFGGFRGTSTPVYLNEILQWTPNVEVDYDINISKPTSTSAVTIDLYWLLQVPSTALKGDCTGTNTFTAVYDMESDISAIRPDASACSSSGECTSGNCVDGYCCDTACDSECVDCSLSGTEGTCTSVTNEQDSDTCTGNNACNASGTCEEVPFCGGDAGDHNTTKTVSGGLVYCDNSDRLWTPTAATSYEWGGYGTDEPTNSCIGIGSRPACNYCDNLTYAGYSDWVLPSCTGDASLPSSCVLYQFGVDNCSWNGGSGGQSSCTPAWDTNAQASTYWSSTEFYSYYAWGVYFNTGDVRYGYKNVDYYVRCVRGQ